MSRGALLSGALIVVAFALLALEWRFGAARASGGSRPTLIVFFGAAAPLSKSLEETLSAAPVQQLVRAHFNLRRLDAARDEALFRQYVGSAGALGSVIVDDASSGEPDVIAVLPGYADVARFSAFLDDVAGAVGQLRQLRITSKRLAVDRLALGELYAQQGSRLRARECFERLRAPGPLFAAALEHLARLDVEAGRTDAAQLELNQAHNTSPPARPDRLLVTEALVLSSERRVVSAIHLLRGSLPALPAGLERARGWLLLGELEHESGHDPEALAAFDKVHSETRASDLLRATDEQIFHVSHPSSDHVH